MHCKEGLFMCHLVMSKLRGTRFTLLTHSYRPPSSTHAKTCLRIRWVKGGWVQHQRTVKNSKLSKKNPLISIRSFQHFLGQFSSGLRRKWRYARPSPCREFPLPASFLLRPKLRHLLTLIQSLVKLSRLSQNRDVTHVLNANAWATILLSVRFHPNSN